MKVLRIPFGIVVAFLALASGAFAAEHKRPRLIVVPPRADRPVVTPEGPAKAIDSTRGARVLAVMATPSGSEPGIQVVGPAELEDGEVISYTFAVTAGDEDLAPLTLDLEYSEGLSVAVDPQGWDCTLGAAGHASCDWPTALLAGETTATATFSAITQPPYGGTAECDPGRSPCAFLRATLRGGTATGGATTAVVVNGNHAPIAVDDVAAVPLPLGPIGIRVLDNDTDADGDALTPSIVVPPTQGTATVDPATNRIVYTPDPSFSGSDTFRYRIADPSGASATALVSIAQLLGSVSFQTPVVDVGNVEPGHVAFRLGYLENTTGEDLFGSVAIEPVDAAEFPALLVGTGYDPAQAVSDLSVFSGAGGLRVVGTFPVTGFFVPVRPNPPLGRVYVARVKLTVSPESNSNIVFEPSYVVVARSADATEVPVHIVDDAVTTPVDTPLLIHPLDNDDSVAGLALSVTSLAAAEPFHFDPPLVEGNLQFADGSNGGFPFLGALYTPRPGFTGTTEFYYAASEAPGGTINGRYDYAKVTVVVGASGNHAPVAHPQTASVSHSGSRLFPLSALASDADNDSLTVQIVTPPAHGTATVLPTGDVRYAPSPQYVGPDAFEFRASDGTDSSNVASVSIAVTNAAPVLGALTNLTVAEFSVGSFTASASDPDNDALTFSLFGAPAGAHMSSNGIFGWVPVEDQGPGTYTFTVRVSETGSPALFDDKQVTITVSEVNGPPALGLPALPAHIAAGLPFVFTATASDTDIPANTLAFSLIDAPAGASIGAVTGAFAWTPTAAQAGGFYVFFVAVTDSGTPNLTHRLPVLIEVDAAVPTPTLLVSSAANRSNPHGLAGQTLSRLAYIFVNPNTSVTRVRFWLDDPSRTGPPRQVENLSPFDFAGTAANGSAQAFDTRGVANGAHVVSAEVTLAGGQVVPLQGTFTVSNTPPALLVSPSPNRVNPRALTAAIVRNNIYVFVQPDPDAVRVRFWLDAPTSRSPRHTETTAPYDFEGTAANGHAAPFDTRSLSRGLHVIAAVVDYPGGVSVETSAVFLVSR